MITKKDFLTTNNSLLQVLDKYTNDQIEKIADSYNYYPASFTDKVKLKSFLKVHRLLNEIIRVIVKNNLTSIYYNNYAQNLDDFVLRVNYDELEPLYDDLSKSGKKINERLMKYVHSRLIKREFIPLASIIRTNRLLRKILTNKTNDIFYDFKEAFELFQKMGMNNREMIDATLCIVSCNIYNGIYVDSQTSMEIEEIKKAHHLIEYDYLSIMETKREFDVNSLVIAFSLLGIPNISAVSTILEKANRKRISEDETTKITIEPVKIELKSTISKAHYHLVMKTISNYYDLENCTVKGILKMSEIQYVVSLMQSLDFSNESIDTFITKSLKKHKSISALDRYLDLSKKIEYYKDERDIEELDKTLHELVNEYINCSGEDKDFWLSSINEELESLESLLNKNHSYELGIRKSQE